MKTIISSTEVHPQIQQLVIAYAKRFVQAIDSCDGFLDVEVHRRHYELKAMLENVKNVPPDISDVKDSDWAEFWN